MSYRDMMAEAEQIKRMEEEISEIKLQIGYILSRFLEEEDMSEEEREEIMEILGEVREGKYLSKDEFLSQLSGE